MSYEKLGVVEFGRELIRTGDLDPVYIALYQARGRGKITDAQLKRWLLAYWFFYHVGVASQLSELRGDEFYAACFDWADTPASKRGTERRHFRGTKAGAAVVSLEKRYSKPEDAVDSLRRINLTFGGVATEVQTWPMFGPWIAFKVADMLERCLGVPVDFSQCELGFYTDPLKGGVYANAFRNGYRPDELEAYYAQTTSGERQVMLVESIAWLRKEFRRLEAPPRDDRPIGVQEIETVLCKWKSHLGGHYPVGKDTREYRAVLESGEWGQTAKMLGRYLP